MKRRWFTPVVVVLALAVGGVQTTGFAGNAADQPAGFNIPKVLGLCVIGVSKTNDGPDPTTAGKFCGMKYQGPHITVSGTAEVSGLRGCTGIYCGISEVLYPPKVDVQVKLIAGPKHRPTAFLAGCYGSGGGPSFFGPVNKTATCKTTANWTNSTPKIGDSVTCIATATSPTGRRVTLQASCWSSTGGPTRA